MKVTITFPDGKRRTYDVEVRRGMKVEDLARQVVDQMYDEARKRITIKNPERWKDAHLRWVLAKVYTALLEKLDMPGR